MNNWKATLWTVVILLVTTSKLTAQEPVTVFLAIFFVLAVIAALYVYQSRARAVAEVGRSYTSI